MTIFIIAVSTVLAAIRVSGHKSQSYQAAAHLWVGWLAGLWTINRGSLEAWTIVALSVVEVACFVWFKMHGPATVETN